MNNKVLIKTAGRTGSHVIAQQELERLNMDMSNFPPQMVAALDSAAEGGYSKPVDMGQGFVILKADNRKKEVTPFEEVKDQIKEEAMKETAQEVVKELKEKANIEFPAEVTKPAEAPATATPAAEETK